MSTSRNIVSIYIKAIEEIPTCEDEDSPKRLARKLKNHSLNPTEN